MIFIFHASAGFVGLNCALVFVCAVQALSSLCCMKWKAPCREQLDQPSLRGCQPGLISEQADDVKLNMCH
jgi:hypothetical protein